MFWGGNCGGGVMEVGSLGVQPLFIIRPMVGLRTYSVVNSSEFLFFLGSKMPALKGASGPKTEKKFFYNWEIFV